MGRVYSAKIALNLLAVAFTWFFLLSQAFSGEGLMSVYVVNYPLKYFAEKIGGPHVNVTLPVPPDVDPVYWKPSIADISAYQQADVILFNGAGYAKWATKVSLPRSRSVDTSRSFKDRYITVKEVMTHTHGPAGKHAHEKLAFTTWLDLSLAARQAEAVSIAFSRKRPEMTSQFRANYKVLEKDLALLDRRLKKIAAQKPARPLLFSHPVYDYLIERYGMNAKSVHWEPDQKPTAEQLSELEQILENHRAGWMVWEGEPINAAVDKLLEMGIKSVVYNPCGNVPKEGDFMSVMRQNVVQLESAFQ